MESRLLYLPGLLSRDIYEFATPQRRRPSYRRTAAVRSVLVAYRREREKRREPLPSPCARVTGWGYRASERLMIGVPIRGTVWERIELHIIWAKAFRENVHVLAFIVANLCQENFRGQS